MLIRPVHEMESLLETALDSYPNDEYVMNMSNQTLFRDALSVIRELAKENKELKEHLKMLHSKPSPLGWGKGKDE